MVRSKKITTKPQSTSQQICEELISQIKVGELPVGATLPTERILCEQFETSRPTVREALAQMQMRGFLKNDMGKRPIVCKPSIENVLQDAASHISEILGDAESAANLEQMRHFIEIGAIREAIKRVNGLQLTQLHGVLEKNFNAIGKDSFPQTDIAFHRCIVSMVGNPIMLTLHDMFVSSLLQHRPETKNKLQHDQIVYEEHRAIYEAVLNGDIEAAAITLDKHLARSYLSRLNPPKMVNFEVTN